MISQTYFHQWPPWTMFCYKLIRMLSLIPQFFIFFSVPDILVTTGFTEAFRGTTRSELIGKGSTIWTNNKDFPIEVKGAFGSNLANNPVICGGIYAPKPYWWYSSDQCYSYDYEMVNMIPYLLH